MEINLITLLLNIHSSFNKPYIPFWLCHPALILIVECVASSDMRSRAKQFRTDFYDPALRQMESLDRSGNVVGLFVICTDALKRSLGKNSTCIFGAPWQCD